MCNSNTSILNLGLNIFRVCLIGDEAAQRLSGSRVSRLWLFNGRSILRLEMLQNWCYHVSDLPESYECCFMHLIVLQYAMHHTVYTLIMCFLNPHLSENVSFCSYA